ncbi:MAG: SMC-Scp complex subunit ScpB [Pseudomonadota bacterium]
MTDRFEQIRLLEAILFASDTPLGEGQMARHLPEDAHLESLLEELAGLYANRGINLVRIDKRWAFRTASDLAPQMQVENQSTRKLSRVALETLAIVAYHQPVTRGEIEEIRGVALSKGTLDALLEVGWIKPKGRRRTPGRPVTWGTTPGFLDHFGLPSLDALPGVEELKAAGLIDARPAITALGERVTLPGTGEVAAEAEDAIEGEEPLAESFGEDLVPEEEGIDDQISVESSAGDGEVVSESSASHSEGPQETAAERKAEDGEAQHAETQGDSESGLPSAFSDLEERVEKAVSFS